MKVSFIVFEIWLLKSLGTFFKGVCTNPVSSKIVNFWAPVALASLKIALKYLPIELNVACDPLKYKP